ncbi:MAG: hypothetical protein HYT39_03145 [Candidatus Sungbacteria bacterium]|nr:hypothetical protein [Candidatus Sungbacteria bacterium]
MIFSPGEVRPVVEALSGLDGVEVMAPPGAAGRVREVIAKEKPDIVITDQTDVAAIIEVLNALPRDRVIVYTDCHVGCAPSAIYSQVQVLHTLHITPRVLAAIIEGLAPKQLSARSLLFPMVP